MEYCSIGVLTNLLLFDYKPGLYIFLDRKPYEYWDNFKLIPINHYQKLMKAKRDTLSESEIILQKRFIDGDYVLLDGIEKVYYDVMAVAFKNHPILMRDYLASDSLSDFTSKKQNWDVDKARLMHSCIMNNDLPIYYYLKSKSIIVDRNYYDQEWFKTNNISYVIDIMDQIITGVMLFETSPNFSKKRYVYPFMDEIPPYFQDEVFSLHHSLNKENRVQAAIEAFKQAKRYDLLVAFCLCAGYSQPEKVANVSLIEFTKYRYLAWKNFKYKSYRSILRRLRITR